MRGSTTRNSYTGPHPTRNPHSRRRNRNPITRFPSESAAATPLLRWKFDDPDSGTKTRHPKNAERASARKLAAAIWRSEAQEIEAVRHSVHSKLRADQRTTKASTLEAELNRARCRIRELEAKHCSTKKKLESFVKQHVEEKALWRMREHEKIRAVVDGMRGDLSIERKNRMRTEVLNTKLIGELSEAKKSGKRLLQDYEKEKKARELAEEVCDELAKEVGEDRTEAEEAKRKLTRVREELEEERRMLQMAEVWREERVQMKLVDAKLALKDRCTQLKDLHMELEKFLKSRNGTNSVIKAELLAEAVAEAVTMQETYSFSYRPPSAAEDILTFFEEPLSNGDDSPATDIFLAKVTNRSGDGSGSEWETLSNGDQSSIEVNDSTDSANRHAVWGTKGRIEWPLSGHERGLQGNNAQIRHVLKQRT